MSVNSVSQKTQNDDQLIKNFLPTAQNFKIYFGVLRKGHGAKMYHVIIKNKKIEKGFAEIAKNVFFNKENSALGIFGDFFGFYCFLRRFLRENSGFRNTRYVRSYRQKKKNNNNKKYCDQNNSPRESQTIFLFFEACFLWRVHRRILLIAHLDLSTQQS
jgi:hypothetical protein